MQGSRARLRTRLVHTVQFRADLGADLHGEVTYGSASPAVACWWEPLSDPTAGDREEVEDVEYRCFVDGPDFDLSTVPLGSLALLPDGRWRPIKDAVQWDDQRTAGVVDHWQLRV